MSTAKLRNIGPKSAAWLRQVGLRSREDLSEVGAVDAFMRVKRAGFKPSLNLLYALEGALRDCHWQEVPEDRRTVLVSEADHPFWEHWWPQGHTIGWEHTFVHELHHFLAAVAAGGRVGPHGADFEDGYRAAEVCDAIVRAGESGARETVRYRSLE